MLHFTLELRHPLFVFNQFGDLERCALRPGNVHSADGWEDVLRPVLARYAAQARPSITRRYFRGDAAFAIPTLFDLLEAEGWGYAIRIKGNSKLYERISWLLRRMPGRPSHKVIHHYTSFQYQAGTWSKPRRVVAKIEFHPGELFPRVGFIVTNRSLPNERVLAFYNDRGTAEQHIKEGKYALKWTRLSCMRFAGIDVPAVKVIDIFVCKLRQKLARATGGDSCIDTVWGSGYRLRDPLPQDTESDRSESQSSSPNSHAHSILAASQSGRGNSPSKKVFVTSNGNIITDLQCGQIARKAKAQETTSIAAYL